jgi:uncharacterized membrane protein
MIDGTTAVTRRGWWWLGLAVVVFVISSNLPIAQTLLPVHQPWVLLLPLLATCAVLGWWHGGSALLATLWTAVAVWRIVTPARAGVSVELLVAGWSAIVAGCFGIALLASRSKHFLSVGVVAVLGALFVSATLIVLTPSGPKALNATLSTALKERGNMDLTNWQNARAQMDRASAASPDTATALVLERFEQNVAALPRLAGMILPAVLALQTLVAMAIAWAVFHRFSRTRLGDDLSRLRDFRFNDQWIWGIIVGLVIALLPALESLRVVGLNLLVFFGALYALRGAAVLAFFLRQGRAVFGVLVGVALLLLLRDGAAIALGLLGLGDTWADWRRRIRPAVS